ncbi:centrosomal protein of 290 kDa isoform X2 [Tribolium castaneum]|uniref:centrosomal protein of 290 kDa isoform X2 n=1 Tax=Tribolium castaneum TaxID=7070 RepID=UPI00077DC96B|nr:PREDICTED: centrosomal protein of 290 kDa isoform X2 [Tribolium castaneum]|eukprot:XP_015840436.1 PREDICTED: centrosomal protein of 290 kDa isoform X2 [Tribolium castaneum]
MDWEYLFSRSPEDFTEEEKDDLYNTVTWYNCDGENLDLKKCIRLIKVSQEVLKYKGEQVEILLHKLDELATQQGEEDIKKLESDTDARSSKSRKSSSLEFENLEQKYLELKSKYKKQVRLNEKNSAEFNKLQKKVANLEQERSRLINELQVINQEDNQSDVSETVKEQHKELVNALHNKNKQISDLLRDIEVAEKENVILREKLETVRDELAVATKELTMLTENLKATKIQQNESSENLTRVLAENENLRDELREILEQKQNFEREMEEFTEEVNVRVDEWKKILEEKEKEITDLRSRQMQSSHHSSLSSLPQDNEPQVALLNKILNEREKQLMEVKTQLHEAVKEMEETTTIIKSLKEEKGDDGRKIADLSESVKELKKQLKTAHKRAQDLQQELSHVEKLIGEKDDDIKDILFKLKDEGQTDLSEYLTQIQHLKSQNRVNEKQIMDLVKTANKLQDSCDRYEKENQALRDRLGITPDEVINISGVIAKQKQQKREISSLKKQIQKLEEENLEIRMQIHKQKQTPEQLDSGRSQDEDISTKNQIKALVEENEALRKGMHEILDSLNSRKETSLKEVKSETFEQLLRALDVKHISGWYHPAMRLQAELHNQEGINAELREQLRLARIESQSVRSVSEKSVDMVDFSLSNVVATADLTTIANIHQTLQDLFIKLDEDSMRDEEIEAKLLSYKESFEQIRQEIGLLYQEYLNEKQRVTDKMSEYEEKIFDLQEANEIKEKKLSLLAESSDQKVSKSLDLAEENVILTRKRSYLENDIKRLTSQVTNLQTDLANAETACLRKINDLSKRNKTLTNSVEILTNQLKFAVDPNDHAELRKNFESLTLKYRDLLTKYTQAGQDKDFQLKMLEEIRKNLQVEKAELENKVLNLSEKLHASATESDEGLAKKLAQSEANELSERQRANHTNNLYELVKEQLQKCEDRCKQVDKYNTEILQKNLVLQEQLKDAENKFVNFIDTATYKALQTKYNELLQINTNLTASTADLQEELALLKKSNRGISHWNAEKEQELLDLKHQIVDLQAISDEKMQIARLGAELSHSRLQEAEYKRKIEQLSEELHDCNAKCEELTKEMQRKALNGIEKENELLKKVSVLRELLMKSKLQYFGCVPLPSEEKFINNIKQAISDKHEAFLNLYNAQITANESSILKEQCEKELKNLEQVLKSNFTNLETVRELLSGHQDKKSSEFNEIKYRRQCALKETQLQHIFDRVKIQDEQIIKLEEELFTLHTNFSFDLEPEITIDHKETTNNMQLSKEIAVKDQTIEELKNKINEYELSLTTLKKQLADKQSQITFYERHIMELQSKKEAPETIDLNKNEEILTLKCSLKTFQDSLKEKEEDILRYQSLLKEDRDKHSMAASLMRDELKVLQKCLTEERQKVAELKSAVNGVHPGKAALEQYFLQVQSLEDELGDLRTQVSSLESQLQASRQEAVRWRVLANDRLETMQKLGQDLEDLHRNEIMAYKNEAEKWREEVTTLKQMISKYRSEMGHDFDFQKLLKEKDDKIHELNVILRHAKSEARKNVEKFDSESSSKVSELESTKEQLLKEHEAIKKRFDQLLLRERTAREEIRELKGKLLKKPILSARSDKSEKSIKEQLQKKVTSLENEIVELKDKLATQISVNEGHRVKIAQNFERWNKQKHFQQLAEKLKNKLKAKEADFEKLQETCAGYRILIERLEREKYNLENKIRSMKSGTAQHINHEIEMLKLENMKLISENEALASKLEMQQHHAGGLGAAMLQEKLEGQERKIAILELSSKGSVEVRAELERLQNTISTLQKNNLCLEAENLELKLDLEKSTKELPHLREQIQHLENYIEVLKKENVESITSDVALNPKSDIKKITELERTIFVLKRVVEKLQAENKRLLTGKRFYPDRAGCGDKLKRDHQRLKEQYCESIQKVAKLEEEVKALKANKPVSDSATVLSDELAQVKEQLEQKTQLLNKVKVLLQRAAVKEKALLQELDELKLQVRKTESPGSEQA